MEVDFKSSSSIDSGLDFSPKTKKTYMDRTMTIQDSSDSDSDSERESQIPQFNRSGCSTMKSPKNSLNQNATQNTKKIEIISNELINRSTNDLDALRHTREKKVGSDQEIYLIQIPKSINPVILHDLQFSITKSNNLESDKYVLKHQPEAQPSVLIFSDTLKKIIPGGTLKLEQCQTSDTSKTVVVEKRTKQQILKDKTFDTTTGSNYRSRCELQEQIQEKLEKALQRVEVKNKTSKKKGKDDFEKNNLISKLLQNKSEVIKIKNEINHISTSSETTSAKTKKYEENSALSGVEIKTDKIKIDMKTDTKTKKKNRKKELEVDIKSTEEVQIMGKKVKRHSTKEEPSEGLTITPKKHKKSILSSTAIMEKDESFFNPDFSAIEVTNLKKKKKPKVDKGL